MDFRFPLYYFPDVPSLRSIQCFGCPPFSPSPLDTDSFHLTLSFCVINDTKSTISTGRKSADPFTDVTAARDMAVMMS